MRILLIPSNTSKTRHIDVRHIKLAALCLALLVLVIGIGLGWLVKPTADSERSLQNYLAEIREVRKWLSEEQMVINSSAKEADAGMSSFGVRIGRLQAELERISAVEQRLVEVAGFKAEDLEAAGGVGGEEVPVEEHTEVDGSITSAEALENHDFNSYVESLLELETKLSQRMDRLSMIENQIRKDKQLELTVPSAWPTSGGYITSRFGKRIDPFTGRYRFHKGIDIANKKGSDILAAADGVVVVSEYSPVKGNVVSIDHGHGYKTWYFHMADLNVVVGDTVKEGDPLGKIGTTGRSTGVHLHFELTRDGIQINPAPYVGYKPKG